MNFGMGDEFEYFQCLKCGCVQIVNIPADLEKFYPSYYGSLKKLIPTQFSFKRKIIERLLVKLHLQYIGHWNFLGFIISFFKKNYRIWLNKSFNNLDSKILDVGCGNGDLLFHLKKIGYKKLFGVDPYISTDININGVNIVKGYVSDLTDKYDIIMFHHSFEHIYEQKETLSLVRELLNDNGFLLIRVPVSDSYAFRKYKNNWIGLDAPRHLFLHGTKSLNHLANKMGFVVGDILYDSDLYQFEVSEKYERGMKLHTIDEIFSAKEKAVLKKEAVRLNRIKDGDCACFFFTKTSKKTKFYN